jgi:hypothetical protein
MTKQEHIDNIMDNFDFNKVAKVMKFLNWQWAMSPTGVPEEPEIRECCRKYLSSTYDHAVQQGRKYTMATGGFVYRYDPHYSELSLVFEVTGWSTNNGAAF